MEDKYIKKTKIERLDIGGQGVGECDGRIAYVWNALPGEEVEFRIFRKRRGIFEGVAEKISKVSHDRIEPREPEHYQSCSPWQMMAWEAENRYKLELAKGVYASVGLVLPEGTEIITGGDREYHYRNKMEYSFSLDDIGDLSFAFFQRGRGWTVPIQTCHLGSTAINQAAEQILQWMNDNPISDEMCKSLIIRSNSAGQAIAALFLNQHFNLPDLPKMNEHLVGFQVYYSRLESPAATPDKLIYSVGEDHISEEINGIKLKFGVLSFFQVNIPVFTLALADIKPWVAGAKNLLDYYSGVGTISLLLNKEFKKCTLVDESRESIKFAKENITANNIKNCEAIHERSEKMTELIKKDDTVILDPPRPGLHKDVVKRIIEIKPKRIIYLSCNIKTQAENIVELMELYEMKFARIYNFFPRTPHIESLVVLDRK